MASEVVCVSMYIRENRADVLDVHELPAELIDQAKMDPNADCIPVLAISVRLDVQDVYGLPAYGGVTAELKGRARCSWNHRFKEHYRSAITDLALINSNYMPGQLEITFKVGFEPVQILTELNGQMPVVSIFKYDPVRRIFTEVRAVEEKELSTGEVTICREADTHYLVGLRKPRRKGESALKVALRDTCYRVADETKVAAYMFRSIFAARGSSV